MGNVSFLVNGQMMQLEDPVYVITRSYVENGMKRMVPAKEQCIVKGKLDTLRFSVGYNHQVVCTGTAMCKIPAVRKPDKRVENIMRIVEFDEQDVSLNRTQLEKRLGSPKIRGVNQKKDENEENGARTDLMDTIECSVTLAGYEVLGAEESRLIVRHGASDHDFSVTIEDAP